jgi:hypothetical protein
MGDSFHESLMSTDLLFLPRAQREDGARVKDALGNLSVGRTSPRVRDAIHLAA